MTTKKPAGKASGSGKSTRGANSRPPTKQPEPETPQPVAKAGTKAVAKPVARSGAKPASKAAGRGSAGRSALRAGAKPAPPAKPVAKVKNPYTKKELLPMRAQLMELRARLMGDMDALGGEALRANEPEVDADDVADLGTDAFERQMNLGLMETEAKTLRRIDTALRLMESGAYGLCQACGQAIPYARLEALPFATNCVPCQEAEERWH